MMKKWKKTPMLLNKETIDHNDLKITKTNGKNENTIINEGNQKELGQSNEYDVEISNASAIWTHETLENTLNNINLSIRRNRLVAIVGIVGAGKVLKLIANHFNCF